MGKKARLKRLKRLGVTIMTPVPPSPCPRCHVTLLAATGIAERREDTLPITHDEWRHLQTPGAVTLCDQCGTWLVFTDDLRLRLATAEEIEHVHPDARKLALELLAMIDSERPKH